MNNKELNKRIGQGLTSIGHNGKFQLLDDKDVAHAEESPVHAREELLVLGLLLLSTDEQSGAAHQEEVLVEGVDVEGLGAGEAVGTAWDILHDDMEHVGVSVRYQNK